MELSASKADLEKIKRKAKIGEDFVKNHGPKILQLTKVSLIAFLPSNSD